MPLPPPLYKYYAAETGLKVLSSGKVRFTPPNEFNDPFDLNPAHDFSEPALRRAAQREAMKELAFTAPEAVPSNQLKRLTNLRTEQLVKHAETRVPEFAPAAPLAYQKGFSERFGVCCFTEHKSSHLMWAHYAAHHSGCVLEFTFLNLQYVKTQALKKVTYSKDRPVIDYSGRPDKSMFTKSDQWDYEDEWRMYAELKRLERIQGENGTAHLDLLLSGTITAVYLGCRIDARRVDEFKIAIAKLPKPAPLLFRMKLHLSKFDLEAEEIK